MPALFFILLCIPLYFLYNVFERKQYLKHFNKFIDHHFKDNIDRKSTIQIEDDRFHVVDDEELWHSYDDIEEVHETNQLMVVQLKNGVAILLPKNKIANAGVLLDKLNKEAVSRRIPVYSFPDWKWK